MRNQSPLASDGDPRVRGEDSRMRGQAFSSIPGANSQGRVLDRLDPITFEILRHRLWVIQGELGTTIKSMSGSPVASEAGDFNTCLMDADGNGILSGLYITAQAAV